MKRIVICFDGTRNDPSDAAQNLDDEGEIEDDGISNVLKLYFLLGGRLANLNKLHHDPNNAAEVSTFPDQPCFYFQGVGTYGSRFQRVFNSMVAPEELDVSKIIRWGAEALRASYQQGDQVFLFGFSRGAAIARRFAKVIRDSDDSDIRVDGIGEGSVRLLSVFDTVSSFGVPNLIPKIKPRSDVLFEEGNRVHATVSEAIHLVSLDERRLAFRPTLMAPEDRVTEVWFPGVHSDVGGGYFRDALSNITLRYLLDEIGRRELGLRFRDATDVVETEFADDEFGLDANDLNIQPGHLGELHWQRRILDLLLRDRDVLACKSGDVAEYVVSQEPMIHHTALDRIRDKRDYKPSGIKSGTPFRKVAEDGSPSDATRFHLGRIQSGEY